ncbi:MAG: hypothetical protein L6V81_00830 [Clostridium sp.]|nr:MAG: hypothetical protein L6V81_00830 [Clostridium sp.]
MYYYGYNGGYAGGNSMMYNNYPGYYSNGYGYGVCYNISTIYFTCNNFFGVGFYKQ